LAVLLDCLPALGLLVVSVVIINVPTTSTPFDLSLILDESMSMRLTILMEFAANDVLLDGDRGAVLELA